MRILTNQPQVFRYACILDGKIVVVIDDSELIEDEGYAPGVMENLIESFVDRDYFTVLLLDSNGEILDSVGSMAGYGSPEVAAKAAIKDYFNSENYGK